VASLIDIALHLKGTHHDDIQHNDTYRTVENFGTQLIIFYVILKCIMLSVIMLNVLMINAIILDVVKLIVMAGFLLLQ
jgi:hypothetical protein